MSIITLFVGLILCYILFRYKRRRLYKLASRIPQPPDITSFIGVLQYSYDATNLIIPLIKRYSLFSHANGGIAKLWVGPYMNVFMIDPEDTEFALKNCLEKHDVMQIFKSALGNAALISPVPIWVRRRKILVPAFSPKILNNFVSILSNRSHELTQQLASDNRVGTGQFSIWPYISTYTIITVTETSLGIDLGAMGVQFMQYLDAMERVLRLGTYRVLHVWLWPDWIYKWTSQSKQYQKSVAIIHSLTDKIIDSKRKELKYCDKIAYNQQTIFGQDSRYEFKSFLEHLIMLSENGVGLNDTELREEIMVFLLAGTDTSAVAICNTLKLLAKYPKIQEKVFEEIKEVFGDSDRLLEKNDLKDIKYFDSVIKESLRLFPPVPLVVRKAGAETKLPSGTILPAGTGILASIWGINRDPKTWGPDADCFDPDRHLGQTKTTAPTMIPFSSGPRNCVGYQYAMLSVKIVLLAILRCYRIVGEEEPGPVPEMECDYSVMMKDKDGYKISLERRS